MPKFHLSVLLTALLLGAATQYAHAVLLLREFEGDPNRYSYILAGSEQAIAEARFGNNDDANPLVGDWEIGVGTDTQASGQFAQAQQAWTSGDTNAWRLTYDDTSNLLSFTVAGNTVNWDVGELTADNLFLRGYSGTGAAAGNGNETLISNVVLDSQIVGIDIHSEIDEQGAEYLAIYDAFTGSFELTGDLRFAWSEVDPQLAGSRPAFQVKIADEVEGTKIPEPATAGLVLLGFAALSTRRRHR